MKSNILIFCAPYLSNRQIMVIFTRSGGPDDGFPKVEIYTQKEDSKAGIAEVLDGLDNQAVTSQIKYTIGLSKDLYDEASKLQDERGNRAKTPKSFFSRS